MQLTTTPSATTLRLNPLALALGFGIAGVVEMLLVGTVMGSMWGMMGGYGGSTMRNGFGLLTYGLFSGFVGGAVMGGIAAWIYNAVIARDARPSATADV